MGRWVVSLIVISGIFAVGFGLWLHHNQPRFQMSALQGLLNDFQLQQQTISAQTPPDYTLNGTESWSFEFHGDELWVTAPSLEKKAGPTLPADFDTVRAVFVKSFDEWLAHRPGDSKRFPVHVRFRNEPLLPPASPSPTPAQ